MSLIDTLKSRSRSYSSKHDVNIRIKEIGEAGSQPIIVLLFYGFFTESDPKESMDSAVETIMGAENYSEFTERYLDNPWMRVVITNFDKLRDDNHYVESNHFSDCIAKKYRLYLNTSNLYYISGGYDAPNPWNHMLCIVADYIKEGHNDFIETSLDNPWEHIVITNFNDLPNSL